MRVILFLNGATALVLGVTMWWMVGEMVSGARETLRDGDRVEGVLEVIGAICMIGFSVLGLITGAACMAFSFGLIA